MLTYAWILVGIGMGLLTMLAIGFFALFVRDLVRYMKEF